VGVGVGVGTNGEASLAGEVSWEYDWVEHGFVFVFVLCEGITNSATAQL
jgi:hypothetical protein